MLLFTFLYRYEGNELPVPSWERKAFSGPPSALSWKRESSKTLPLRNVPAENRCVLDQNLAGHI